MFKAKDNNIVNVGFFGQSGAGKSTLIKTISNTINGKAVIKNLDIIRNLFLKNENKYDNLEDFLKQKDEIMSSSNPGSMIAELYLKFIKSQLQLLNDYSTEVFEVSRQDYYDITYSMYDRTPLDFFVFTECALKKLYDVYGGKINNKSNSFYRDLLKKVAIENTIKFFDVIFVVYPWTKSKTNLFDGVRDEYLSEYFVGENWYDKIKSLDLGKTKIIEITENTISLEKRIDIVSNVLVEIKK